MRWTDTGNPLCDALTALSHPARLSLLAALVNPMTRSQAKEIVPNNGSLCSHFKILERAGLIEHFTRDTSLIRHYRVSGIVEFTAAGVQITVNGTRITIEGMQ